MKITSENQSTFVLALELALIKLARVLEASPPIIHQDIWRERMEAIRNLRGMYNVSISDNYNEPLLSSKESCYYKEIIKIYFESHQGYPWSKYNAFLTDLLKLIVQYHHLLGEEKYRSSSLQYNHPLPKDMQNIVINLLKTDYLLEKKAKKDSRVKKIIKTDNSAKKARLLDQKQQQNRNYNSYLPRLYTVKKGKEKQSDDSEIERKLHLENLETRRLEAEVSLIQRELKAEKWNEESLKEQRVWCRNNCIPKTQYEQIRKMDTLREEEYAESQEKRYKQILEDDQEKICSLKAIKISLLEKILLNESPNLGEQSSSEKKLLI